MSAPSTSSKPRVAFVVQRYGLEITGGSEAHCRQVVERLADEFDIEILTTCATDHLSWKNELPEGLGEVNGIKVRRFPTTAERHLLNFHSIYDRIFLEQLDQNREMALIHWQGPVTPSLEQYIEKNKDSYDAFVFFTYMYWTTVNGLPRVGPKALFVPTVHDEPSLYLHILDHLFRQTKHIMFNTEEERLLIFRRFNLPSDVGRIVGVGVDDPKMGEYDPAWKPLQERLRGKRVMTYVGRVENGKGCDELVDFFLRFVREENRSDFILLLLGRRTLPLPPHNQIISPGFVSEYVKHHAVAGTDIAVVPSPYESLSMSALESWMLRRPVLANGRSPVLVGHCTRSNGGLWYNNYAEFRETVKLLLSDNDLCNTLGKQGRDYVERNYRWSVIEQIWRDELHKVISATAQRRA
ncbi:MAG: glycosyltransferase family 4 protein [Bryobacteraceae bacterium]|nr:glycosyltransferase family 4 protein [Bryobacteraceae bacterium]